MLKKTTNNSFTTDILDFQGLLFLKPRAGTRKDGISKRKDHLPTIHFQIFCCKFQLGTVAPPKNRLDMDHGTSSQKSWFPFSGPPKIMTSYAKKRSSCTSQNDVEVPQPVLQITGQTRVEIDVFLGWFGFGKHYKGGSTQFLFKCFRWFNDCNYSNNGIS